MRWGCGPLKRNSAVSREVRRYRPVLFVALLCTLGIIMGACGGPSAPNPPARTCISGQYHFQLNYPDGWKAQAVVVKVDPSASPLTCVQAGSADVTPGGSAAIPLTVILTHTNGKQVASHVSTLTIEVISLSELQRIDADSAKKARELAKDKTLHAVQLAGLTAYESDPVDQPVTGADVSITHTDYYLVHDSVEYQLSTDAVSDDGAQAALQSMLQSFAFTA
jgi:hypothetical protein